MDDTSNKETSYASSDGAEELKWIVAAARTVVRRYNTSKDLDGPIDNLKRWICEYDRKRSHIL